MQRHRPYTPVEPNPTPQFAWAVKDEDIRNEDEHSWVVCSRCNTVSFYDLPKGEDWGWINKNVKCPRCKAFASKLSPCSPEVFYEAKRERDANPPPMYSPRGGYQPSSNGKGIMPTQSNVREPAERAPVTHALPAGRVVDPAKPFDGKFYFFTYAHRDEKGLIRIQGNGVCCNKHAGQLAADDERVIITSLQEITEAEYDVLAEAIPQR